MRKGRRDAVETQQMSTITISVITVCYQAEHVIDRTIKSVLAQTYPHVEYLIIDGASTDGTEELVKPYARDGKLQWFSEPDEGIYDAMNRGVARASGDYVIFLNAGDTFSAPGVLKQLAAVCRPEHAEVLYGNITYLHPDGHTEQRVYGASCGRLIYYLTGDCINHQAILAHKRCFDNTLFDTKYRICADRDWMMRVKKRKVPFVCTGEMIACYSLDEDSASIRERDIYRQEAKRCIRRNLPWGYPVFALFEFCRNNRLLAKLLHGIYRLLYIRS